MQTTKLTTIAFGLAALFALTSCASGGDDPGGRTGGDLTLRLWDGNVAAAYETSIDAFEAANPGITVTIEVVPWEEYFSTLRTDVSSGNGADVFWLNGSSFQDYADNELLLPVSQTLGPTAQAAWDPVAVREYTRDDELWGVPQIVDGGSAIYYNADLLEAAGITPDELSALVWDPRDPEVDTLVPALRRLTVDEAGRDANDPAFDAARTASWGFNAAQDTQNILLNFIGSNGGTYQDVAGGMTFTDPRTTEAIRYVVDLVNTARVSPPASSTNADGDHTRDEFLAGRIALFQSGTYNLANVQAGAEFDWGVVEIPGGPSGRVTTSPGVIAAASANTEHPQAVQTLLEWLGSPEGNAHIGRSGAAVPAVTAARAEYDAYWEAAGIDVTPFFSVLDGATPMPAVTGQNYGAVSGAFKPYLDEVFLGRLDVEAGLLQAQRAADAID